MDSSALLTAQVASNTKGKLFSVQYLRAAAAFMVAYLHMLEQAPGNFSAALYPERLFDSTRLKAGVDIFFVISGFIMLVTSQRSSPGQFAVRRIIRIVPLYWILTIAMAAMVWLRPNFFPRTVQNFGYLLKSLFFIPFVNIGYRGDMVPLLAPGWTLNFEMYFYAIFAVILFAPARYRVPLNGLVFVTLIALRGLTHASGHTIMSFYTSPQILEFWVGMLIAEAYLKNGLRMSRFRCVTAILIGFIALLFNWSALSTSFGIWSDTTLAYLIPSAAIVMGTVAYESTRSNRPNRFLTLLGDSSYSIYLSHLLFLGASRALWRWVCPTAQTEGIALLFGSISIIVVTISGIAIYKLIERPILTLMHEYVEKSRGRLMAAKNTLMNPPILGTEQRMGSSARSE